MANEVSRNSAKPARAHKQDFKNFLEANGINPTPRTHEAYNFTARFKQTAPHSLIEYNALRDFTHTEQEQPEPMLFKEQTIAKQTVKSTSE